MLWILISALLVIGGVAFVLRSNQQTQRAHADFGKRDVVDAIENVLSGAYHDEFDLFLAWPIRDSYLESIRQQCIAICKEYSGTEPGKDIATDGQAKLRLILEDIKAS